MAAELAKLAAEADPTKNPYLNKSRAAGIKAIIDKTLKEGKTVGAPARLQYAYELLYSGDSAGAVEQCDEIKQLVDRGKIRIDRPRLIELRHLRGFALFRLGEQENCLSRHGIDSCLLPIRGDGLHTELRGMRGAIEQFAINLRNDPNDLESRWLLNIAQMAVGEYPDKVAPAALIPPRTFESEYDIKRFYNIAGAVGLDIIGLAGGAITEDFDGDGLLDVMFSSWGLSDPMHFFHNDGDGAFSDRTDAAGLTGLVSGLNMNHADYDNDGDADVVVFRGAWLKQAGLHPESLIRNNGDGTFEDVTFAAGLVQHHPTHSGSWLDYNNDGWLDLYVGHESREGVRHPSQLFHNHGDGTFTDVAGRFGIDVVGFVKGVTSGDFNNDGRPDLYLSLLGEPNVLLRNDGPARSADAPANGGEIKRLPARPPADWKFTDVTRAAGVAEPLPSFPTWFWDYNNDGWLDIFVCGYGWSNVGDQAADYLRLPHRGEQPRLYRNNKDGTFTDVHEEAGLHRLLIAMGANFGDLDNDGWPDFYLGTGDPQLKVVIPNRMFRNDGGRRFQDVTTVGGFGHLQKGHGVAFADLDNDGDQDVLEEMGGALDGDRAFSVLFENPGHGNHWITLRLEGVRSNRSAIHARIRVRVKDAAGPRDIFAVVTTGGSFGSNSLQQEIGLGAATAIEEIEITWPSSATTQRFAGVEPDRRYHVLEGRAELRPEPQKPITFKRPAGAQQADAGAR